MYFIYYLFIFHKLKTETKHKLSNFFILECTIMIIIKQVVDYGCLKLGHMLKSLGTLTNWFILNLICQLILKNKIAQLIPIFWQKMGTYRFFTVLSFFLVIFYLIITFFDNQIVRNQVLLKNIFKKFGGGRFRVPKMTHT